MTWKEREKEYQAEYRIANRDAIVAKKREWREKNLEAVRKKEREYRANNRERFNAYTKEWKRNNPEKTALIYRRQNLKAKYGMTIEDYDKMLAAQNGVCAICELPEKLKKQNLVVDHNHETGSVRGLLCNDCNRNLIAQRNCPNIFIRAAEYLEKYNGIRQRK